MGRAIRHITHGISHAVSGAAHAVGSTVKSVAKGVGSVGKLGIGAAKTIFEKIPHGLGDIGKMLSKGIGTIGGMLNPMKFVQNIMKGGPLGLLGAFAGGPLGMLTGGGLGDSLKKILGGGLPGLPGMSGGPLGIFGPLLGGNGPGGLLPGLPQGILQGPLGMIAPLMQGGPPGLGQAEQILRDMMTNMGGAYQALQDPFFNMQSPLQGLLGNFQKAGALGLPTELMQMQSAASDVMSNFAQLQMEMFRRLGG
jgi:hypothetical protein